MSKASFFATLPTGFPSLDLFLEGGWPQAALTELHGNPGGGKSSLAFGAAQALTQQKQPVALLSQGETFFPPALAAQGIDLSYLLWLHPKGKENCHWAAQQLTQSGLFRLVIVSQVPYDSKRLRKLQLLSERNQTTVLFLTSPPYDQSLYAFALRLKVEQPVFETFSVSMVRSRKSLPHSNLEISADGKSNFSHILSPTPSARATA